MERDIFKKIRLISKSGFLASSLINIEAMNNIINESKINNEIKINNGIINESEIKTLEQILNPNGVKDFTLLNNDKTYKIIDKLYNKLNKQDISFLKIIDEKDFLKFLNEHKEDILWAIKLGNEKRKNAYYLAKNLLEYINRREKNLGIKKNLFSYRQKLVSYFTQEDKDKNINPKDTDLGKIYNPIIEKFKSQNINNKIFKINKKFDCSKLLIIPTHNEFNDDKIWEIGRNVLHDITKDIYNKNGNDKGSSELKRLFNGEMNCTCNTFMLYTFLRLNKILCYNYMMRGHVFVLIPLKDEKNKAINFYEVELDEKGTINDMKFWCKDIIKISSNNNIWEGMNIDKNKGKSSLSDYSIFYNGFTPTYMYYKNLRDFIDNIIRKIKKEKYKIKKKDIELIKYYLTGLKNAWEYINKKHKDKDGNYIVKFLPIEKGNCLFLPNVLDLGEPKFVKCNDVKSSYDTIMFKSLKNPEKFVNLMYANIHVPDKYNYENIENVKLKINKIDFELYKIEYSISYKDKEIEIFLNNEKSNIENNKCAYFRKSL